MGSMSTFDMFKHIRGSKETFIVEGESLTALQRVLSMMLTDIDRACREASVDYTLGGGTCLGAVRHRGFIPWDDDVDINMPHWQFPIFRDALERLYPGKYFIEVPGETASYDLAFPRIRLRGTIERSRDDFNCPAEQCGVYVDVFYIENAPSNVLARGLHGFVSMALGFLYSCRRFSARAEQYEVLAGGDEDTLAVFHRKERIGRLLSFRSPEQWTALWDRWNSLCRNKESKYVCIPAGRKHYFGEIYPRDSFFPTRRLLFEGIEASAPADADNYLRVLFGPDYMTPPPEDEREIHVVYEFDLGRYGIEAGKEVWDAD